MKAHRVTFAFEHRAPEIVVEDDAWHGAEGAKGLDVMTAQPIGIAAQARIVKCESGCRTAPSRGPNISLHEAHRELSDVRPVDVRFLLGAR